MANDEPAIPLIGQLEDSGLQLLATRKTTSCDRRMEDWIASNLDAELAQSGASRWSQLIANLPASKRKPAGKPGGPAAAGTPTGWSRFNIAYRRGIAVVRLVDRALVDQAHIQEMGRDLLDMIDVGNHRLVINFTVVERLGSWIIGVVGNALRRCAAGDGGKLKICGLDPSLAEIFSIVGMAGELELHADEAAAIESPWPARLTPRQLPIDILTALLAIGGIPPLGGGAPGEEQAELAPWLAPASRPSPPRSFMPAPAPSALAVSLVVRIGQADSRTVAVDTPRFMIGRDGACQLRLGSAQVSKRHAALEQRDGRVYLRDLGSTNGTCVNGRQIRDLEVELSSGDQIQIGPALATLAIGIPQETPELAVDLLAEAVAIEIDDPTLLAPLADSPCTEELPLIDDLEPAHRIKHETLENVLVITPQIPELEDEAILEALRSRLAELFEEPLPRRVVVNLEFVNHLSRQTIALLLAHHFRLEWAGGGLRICQAHARIVALLDQVRMTMLVDCFPTLDEAVLAAWVSPSVASPASR